MRMKRLIGICMGFLLCIVVLAVQPGNNIPTLVDDDVGVEYVMSTTMSIDAVEVTPAPMKYLISDSFYDYSDTQNPMEVTFIAVTNNMFWSRLDQVWLESNKSTQNPGIAIISNRIRTNEKGSAKTGTGEYSWRRATT